MDTCTPEVGMMPVNLLPSTVLFTGIVLVSSFLLLLLLMTSNNTLACSECDGTTRVVIISYVNNI